MWSGWASSKVWNVSLTPAVSGRCGSRRKEGRSYIFISTAAFHPQGCLLCMFCLIPHELLSKNMLTDSVWNKIFFLPEAKQAPKRARAAEIYLKLIKNVQSNPFSELSTFLRQQPSGQNNLTASGRSWGLSFMHLCS